MTELNKLILTQYNVQNAIIFQTRPFRQDLYKISFTLKYLFKRINDTFTTNSMTCVSIKNKPINYHSHICKPSSDFKRIIWRISNLTTPCHMRNAMPSDCARRRTLLASIPTLSPKWNAFPFIELCQTMPKRLCIWLVITWYTNTCAYIGIRQTKTKGFCDWEKWV